MFGSKKGEKTRVGCWLAWPQGDEDAAAAATSCCVCPSNQREEGEPMMSRVPQMGMKVGKQFYNRVDLPEQDPV